MIVFNKEYVCRLPYSDGTGLYEVGDKFVPWQASPGNGFIWIYPEMGHPVPLEVLLHCFEEVAA